ncbi:hypothetical protein D9619_009932 [Psilocybe cf. subviscida]|uniref:Uncharacterized protein n=1 Tax=Psilocybe cf. subviscida TaxID=2480587 RepID=A0A8H5BL62_9AGAR|nr:hypothetical protein D9619_009932 [Psilocybe cf. subviscida]
MQVPYLFSYLLQTALPNLRSLEVKQNPMSSQADSLEGVQWSPTVHDDDPYIRATQSTDYISFLVEACPNIEELGFSGRHFFQDKIMDSIGTCIAEFPFLKHIYYPLGYEPSSSQQLVDLARKLASICLRLESIAHLRKGQPPEVAWIVRDSTGVAQDVVIRNRWGKEISNHDDDPFPDTRPYIRNFDY